MTLVKVPGPQSPSDGDGGPLQSGARATGTVLEGDADVYTITANAGDSLFVTFAEADGQNSVFDPSLVVYGPGGEVLASDFDNSVGGEVGLTDLAQGGTYYVMVHDSFGNDAGDYALTAVRAPGPQPVDADSGPIASGQRVSGSVGPGDYDVYTIPANAGTRLIAALSETGAENTTFDPTLRLFAPDGSLLAQDFDNSVSAFIFTDPLAQAGLYTLLVSDSFGNDPGTYDLSVVDPANFSQVNADGDGGPTATGQARLGEVLPGDLDTFTIDAGAGQTILATLAERSGANTTFDPSMWLFGPGGTLLQSDVDNSVGAILSHQATVAGRYTLLVADSFGNDPGEYAATLSVLGRDPSADEDGQPLQSGGRVGPAVPLGVGDHDIYPLSLDAGDSFLVTLGETGGDFDPNLWIIGPDGSSFGGDFGNSVGAVFGQSSVAAAGTYYAVVYDSNADEAGSYAITAAVAPAAVAPDLDNGPLASGQSRAGALPLGDVDVFTVAATAGTPFTLNVAETPGGSISPSLLVYGPTGVFAGFDDGSSAATVTVNPAVTGTYAAFVYDANADDAGSYAVALNAPADGDTLAPRVESAAYRFDDPSPNLKVYFTEDVGPVTFDDLLVRDLSTGQPVDEAGLSLTYDQNRGELTVGFPGFFGKVLPDGDYRLEIGAGDLADAAGNPLAQGVALDFFTLAGDFNRNRVVNTQDLLVILQSFGRRRSFAGGDNNYDGIVNTQDLLAVLQAFGTSLPAPPPAAGLFGEEEGE